MTTKMAMTHQRRPINLIIKSKQSTLALGISYDLILYQICVIYLLLYHDSLSKLGKHTFKHQNMVAIL